MSAVTVRIRRNLAGLKRAVASGEASERRRFRRHLQYVALRQVVDYLGVETDDGFFVVPTADRIVGKSVYVDGGWERSLLPNAVALANVDLGAKVFLEVGANIGTTTVPAASLAGKVLAFEPVPANFRLLVANVAVNELTNVDCRRLALSDKAGEVRMTLSRVNSGNHRVDDRGGLAVPVQRLDDAIADEGVRPEDVGLCWIDTEGHELSVLLGAPGLLAAAPPLVIEYEPAILSGTRTDLVDLLRTTYTRLIDMKTGQQIDHQLLGDGATDILCLR